MLHTKFRGNRPPVLDKILKGFYHIWAWRPSWSCDPDVANKLSFPYPRRLHIKFGFDWPSVSEKMFKHCGRRMDDRRTPNHWYTISSPMNIRPR